MGKLSGLDCVLGACVNTISVGYLKSPHCTQLAPSKTKQSRAVVFDLLQAKDPREQQMLGMSCSRWAGQRAVECRMEGRERECSESGVGGARNDWKQASDWLLTGLAIKVFPIGAVYFSIYCPTCPAEPPADICPALLPRLGNSIHDTVPTYLSSKILYLPSHHATAASPGTHISSSHLSTCSLITSPIACTMEWIYICDLIGLGCNNSIRTRRASM